MDNVNLEVDGNTLIIKINLTMGLGPSKSGKTDMIATTHGAVKVPDHPGTYIGVNCYKYIKER